MSKNKDLFCIHVQGMDDIIPVHSMAIAVRAAAYLNAEYLAHHAKQDDDITPYCFVVPMVWPGTPEAHAEMLNKRVEEAKRTGQVAAHWMLD